MSPPNPARLRASNGLLRQSFPRSSDLALQDQAHLDQVAVALNGGHAKRSAGAPHLKDSPHSLQ